MGGCCCFSSRRSEADRAPVHIYHQQNLEGHEPLSSGYDGSSPASAIVAVDTNLDTSTPDTYRAPPAPLPYDVGLPVTENPDLEKSDIKSKTDDQQESLKVDEYESCEKGVPEDKPEEEDVCPICLEEYDEENPRSITKCEHHFHLCCILEWMERSETCPVCDQVLLERILGERMEMMKEGNGMKCVKKSSLFYTLCVQLWLFMITGGLGNCFCNMHIIVERLKLAIFFLCFGIWSVFQIWLVSV